MIKQLIMSTACLFTFSSQAQKNILLERDFWKKDPAITDIETLIKQGNDPTELNVNAFDPTVLAINEKASNDVIKYMLSIKGNDVNKITHDKRTYIFWAAYRGNIELMEYLVRKGAKTNLFDDKGYSILNFAASTGQLNTKVYDLCIKLGINPKKDLDYNGANALLLVAPHDKELNLINYFVSKGLDIHSMDKDENTAFNYAAKSGNISIMEALIKKGVKYNNNAMILASQGGRGISNTLEVYQYLEKIGINPTAIGKNGENALHYIVRREKQNNIIDYFLSKGVDINKTDNDGNTPFMNAASANNDIELISSLSSKIKDINQVNKKGISALAFAIRDNTTQIVQFLIEKGADTKVTDNNGDNLAFYLIQSYNPQKKDDLENKLEILKKQGFDFTIPQKNGNTLYHLAVAKNDPVLLKLISSYDIDINTKNKENMTALHKAALIAKDDSILKILLSLGAKKDIKTDLGETAYDLAVENDYLTKNKIFIDFLK